MTENTNNQENAAAENSDQPVFNIQRLYLKDSSFESPSSPHIFREEWKPSVNLDLSTQHKMLEPDVYEVVLRITATVKQSEKTAFISEVQYAGIFTIKQFPKDRLGMMIGSFCPNVLFAYVREIVSETSMRGGFPPLYLQPVNFDALYMQKLQAEKDKAEGKVTSAEA